MKIAFDVDGTLFDYDNKPRTEIMALLRALSDYHVIVWSGGGVAYAQSKIRELELEDFVTEYRPKIKVANSDVDIAFDDQEVQLARHNIKV